MPRIGTGSIDVEQQALPTSHYGFSAIRLDDLEQLGNEWTLVQIQVDKSGSTDSFKPQMEQTIGAIVTACAASPRKDFLLVRLVSFDTKLEEIHGFVPLTTLDPKQYGGCLGRSGGLTALYQSALNGSEALLKQGTDMAGRNFTVNAIDIVLTDGCDTERGATPQQIAHVRRQSVAGEQLESLVSILVGVNVQDPSVGRKLADFQTDAGFTQYVELDQADERTLAKLAAFVSKSISSQSQSLGTGGPSKSLAF